KETSLGSAQAWPLYLLGTVKFVNKFMPRQSLMEAGENIKRPTTAQLPPSGLDASPIIPTTTALPQLTVDFHRRHATMQAPAPHNGRQRQLTLQLLQPSLTDLTTDLLRLRAEFDAEIARKADPAFARYPIGFCLEICKGVLSLVQRELAAPVTPGIRALRQF